MATIKDIAEMAGVSITTVSRILNNDSSLSTTMETKQKVIDAAKKLNYKKVGRSTKATFRLGIVQWFSAEQELQDTYYLSVRNGIEDFCIKNCIQIVRAFKTDVNYMDYLENINGLICIGKFSKKEVKELKRISKNIVFLDMPVADYSVTSFTLDFEYAVNKAMSYLTKLGHTKIGFLGGREILDTDEGARYIGEFAIGVNPYVLKPMKDTLFDEKIAGSIHFTPGQAYKAADNGNKSSIHWDLVLIQREEWGGGEIWFDDVLIRKDGIFVLDELKVLNPENLK